MGSNNSGVTWGQVVAVLGAAASAAAILTWFGIANIHDLDPGPDPSPASSSAAAGALPITFPPAVTTTTPASSAPAFSPLPVTTSPTVATPAFDPSLLGLASTDPAPFTAESFMPQNFTDGKGVEYSYQSGGLESCPVNGMSSDVQSVLRQYGCAQMVTGQYTEVGATSRNDVLVSVEVFAFTYAGTANQVKADFPANGNWSFGFFCAPSGDGAAPCASGADWEAATQGEEVTSDYRYLVEATAIYTDLGTQSSNLPWTTSAAVAAVTDAGPAYYVKTQQQ